MVNTKKLFKTALKGVVSRTLVATVLLSSLSPGAVRAAAAAPKKFIPVADLNTSNTKYGLFKSDSVTDKVAQKVYFGKNPNFDKTPTDATAPKQLESEAAAADQGWYIAGYDSITKGLVLLCDPLQPMGTGVQFYKDQNEHDYNASWNCAYSSDEPINQMVYANHYGGSDIRNTTLKSCLTNNFTSTEQDLIEPTTVATIDKKNSDAEYKTTDKLYLGYAPQNGSDQLTCCFGANNDLQVGLKGNGPTGSPYIANKGYFWLRSPFASDGYWWGSPDASDSCTALDAETSNYVAHNYVDSSSRCVPACALNLSSVIFASAAKPQSSSNALSDGVYFRVANPSGNAKISTTATASGDTITVNKAAEDDAGEVYLMVQGNDGTDDWVYSKKLEQLGTIDANTIHSGLTNLGNCKVWLETTDDNVIYATEPVDGTSDITQVTIAFPKATVTAPTPKTLTYNGIAQELVNAGTAVGGTMQYKLGEDGEYKTDIPTATYAGEYTVYYKAVGSDGFEDSDEGNVSVTIANATAAPKKFITKDAMGADTKYGLVTGKTLQKMYFGKNGGNAQGWYIAGYDSTTSGLVLVCDPSQPMDRGQFLAEYKEENGKYYNKTAYTSEWGCDYSSSGGTAPTGEVYANHYGGSDIRNITLKNCLKNNFTDAEREMIKPTTVETIDQTDVDDASCTNKYKTTDKLYLGYVPKSGSDQVICYFGANNDLQVGLKGNGPENGRGINPYVDSSKGDSFWLRSPSAFRGNMGLDAGTDRGIINNCVNYYYRCIPACALNLESVIFASAAAPAASSSARGGGVYLRVANPSGDAKKISTTATVSGNILTVTKGSEVGDVYLMVQGNAGCENDWVYSKKLEQLETISMDDIHSGLTNLENCKVWLETTNDNVTYATKPVDGTSDITQIIVKQRMYVTLKNEYGGAVTNVDGITLSINSTNLTHVGNGVFKTEGLDVGSYTLTVTVGANSSYSAPDVTTYTINNDASNPSSSANPCRVIKLKQIAVKTGRVITGVGGDAGYEYDRATGKTIFYCKPAEGYKVDKIEKDENGIVKYVSFKIL